MSSLLDNIETVWSTHEKLFKDHLQEVLSKWDKLDDEIWAKVIYMERNHRVSKAYLRAPEIEINGSDHEFDGHQIGLCRFHNRFIDRQTRKIKSRIGPGVKIAIEEFGNITVEKFIDRNVFVKRWKSSASILTDAIVGNNEQIELGQKVELFNMKNFRDDLVSEIRSSKPNKQKLEQQCISVIAFEKNALELLKLPSWVVIINIVAMDMIKHRLSPIIERPRKVQIEDTEKSTNSNSTENSTFAEYNYIESHI